MGDLFPNQAFGRQILKHNNLPVFVTDEFDFFRCIEFQENFYGKTVSALHAGNLRTCDSKNRYSTLFPYQKISYWADSVRTARAELKFHTKTNNILTFWAYDDLTSTFPALDNTEPFYIVDGREFSFEKILRKNETGKDLTVGEKEIIRQIIDEHPDALAYASKRRKGGVNYLFFEKGFKKLSLKKVLLRLGNRSAKNTSRIICADGCDYTPYIQSYGESFEKVAKTKMNEEYLKSEEYLHRRECLNLSYEKYSLEMKK